MITYLAALAMSNPPLLAGTLSPSKRLAIRPSRPFSIFGRVGTFRPRPFPAAAQRRTNMHLLWAQHFLKAVAKHRQHVDVLRNEPVPVFLPVVVVVEVNVFPLALEFIKRLRIHRSIRLQQKRHPVDVDFVAARFLDASLFVRPIRTVCQTVAQFVGEGEPVSVGAGPFAAHARVAKRFTLVNLANLLRVRLGKAKSLISNWLKIRCVEKSRLAIRREIVAA